MHVVIAVLGLFALTVTLGTGLAALQVVAALAAGRSEGQVRDAARAVAVADRPAAHDPALPAHPHAA